MIAIKLIGGSIAGAPTDWPQEIRHGVSSLPEGFDFLLRTEQELTAYLASRQEAYNAWKASLPPPETPPAPVPMVVRPDQLRIAIRRLYGITLAQVDAIIAAIPDAIARDEAQMRWEYATTIRRDHPLVSSLSAQLGLTPLQVDEAFKLAATI